MEADRQPISRVNGLCRWLPACRRDSRSLPSAVSRFGYRLPGPLDTPSAVQLVATRLRQAGLPLNVFFFAIILQLLLARFNVIAARARSTFS